MGFGLNSSVFLRIGWICLGLVLGQSGTFGASQVLRVLPPTASAAEPFTVTNIVMAAEEVLVYAVEEEVPAGWSVSQISFGGQVDLASGKIKWGPFFDNQSRALTYRLIAPLGVKGVQTIAGTASFNGERIQIAGQTTLRIGAAGIDDDINDILSLLPSRFTPGTTLTLTNRVRLAGGTIVYAVEENVPDGWSVGSMNHGGQWDRASAKIKWGPFLDHVTRDLVCELKSPLTATGTVTFAGVGSFDGGRILIRGQLQSQAEISTVERQMAARYQAGEVIPVKLIVTPASGITVLAVQEQVPPGFEIDVNGLSPGGQLDPDRRTIRWGPLFTNGVLTLSYSIKAPAVALEVVAKFSGVGAFDGRTTPIGGVTEIVGVGSRVTREMAAEFLPGASLTVTNRVIPDQTVTVYAVEETVPSGWDVRSISNEGQFDSINRKVKWGPFLDRLNRLLTYTAVPPANAKGRFSFEGIASFNGRVVRIAGQQETRAVSVQELNTVTRSLPDSVRVGRSVWVTNQVQAAEGVSVYAAEEHLPAGWTATNITQGGTLDLLQNKVKWGPFFDSTARQLIYSLISATNANGVASLGGVASFNGELVPITGTASIRAIPNHSPFAQEDTFARLTGQPLSLSVTNLLANDSDPDGDALAVAEVASISKGGATIKVSGAAITYTVAASFDLPDEFTYQIADGFGGVAVGVVKIQTVTSGQSANRLGVETLPTGAVRLRFVGIPGRAYRIQASESLVDAKWTTLGARIATGQGDFEFEDSDALFFKSRFYRTVSP